MLVVGLCTGIALITKQNVGIYLSAALLLVLILEARDEGARAPGSSLALALRRALPLAAGIGLAAAPGLLYFAYQGLLPELAYSGLIRPFTDYASTSAISFWRPLQWWELTELQGTAGFSYFPETVWTLLRRQLLPGGEALYRGYWLAGEVFVRSVYTAMALGFLGALYQQLRPAHGAGAGAGKRAQHFTLLCIAVTLSAFPRADFAHIMGIYPLVLLLLFVVAGEAGGRLGGRPARALRVIEAAVVTVILTTVAALSYVLLGSMTAQLELSRASLRVWPEDAFVASVVRYIEERVPEDQPIFVYGHEAYYYFLTGRYTPWPFSQLYPGQAGGDKGETLGRLLEETRPPFIIQGFIRFPGVPGLPDQVPALDAYIREQYEPTEMPFRLEPPPSGQPPPVHRLQILELRR